MDSDSIHSFVWLLSFSIIMLQLIFILYVSTSSFLLLTSTPIDQYSCRSKWHHTPVFPPGESHGQRSLEGSSHWVAEWDTTEHSPIARTCRDLSIHSIDRHHDPPYNLLQIKLLWMIVGKFVCGHVFSSVKSWMGLLNHVVSVYLIS